MVLIDKDLWDVVDETEKKPENDENGAAAWTKKDKKALATISLTIKDSELVHVRTCKSSSEAWKKLAEVYETKGLARRLYLRRKFFTMQFQDNGEESMQEHINNATILAEQLDAIGAPVTDEDIAMTLLSSLPESYENLIVALESKTEISAEFVRSRLLQEEARRKESSTVIQGESALITKERALYSRERGKGQYRGREFGQQLGHQSSGHQQFDGTCDYCGRYGHKRIDCFKRQGYRGSYRGGRGGHQGVDRYSNSDRENQNHNDQVNFVDAEGTAFIAAYSVGTRDNDEWHIDSGATQHLSSRKDWFHDYKDIEPRNIHLADNRIITAKGIGTIRVKLDVNGIQRNGTFYEVLYTPDLHGNLLSVNKIVTHGHKVIFNESRCIIRDRRNGYITAIATRMSGLYRLNTFRNTASRRFTTAPSTTAQRTKNATETVTVELGSPITENDIGNNNRGREPQTPQVIPQPPRMPQTSQVPQATTIQEPRATARQDSENARRSNRKIKAPTRYGWDSDSEHSERAHLAIGNDKSQWEQGSSGSNDMGLF
jgi:gag-polypeptide of LTR copia-type